MEKIKITKIKSTIGQSATKKATMVALGLNKINQSVLHTNNASIKGMVKSVQHLISVEKHTNS